MGWATGFLGEARPEEGAIELSGVAAVRYESQPEESSVSLVHEWWLCFDSCGQMGRDEDRRRPAHH